MLAMVSVAQDLAQRLAKTEEHKLLALLAASCLFCPLDLLPLDDFLQRLVLMILSHFTTSFLMRDMTAMVNKKEGEEEGEKDEAEDEAELPPASDTANHLLNSMYGAMFGWRPNFNHQRPRTVRETIGLRHYQSAVARLLDFAPDDCFGEFGYYDD